MRISVFLLAIAFADASRPPAFDRITADGMRADLTYLASDALEGRDSPSHGLDLAADYIAARFREGGLAPASPKGNYFQTAAYPGWSAPGEGFRMILKSEGREVPVPAAAVRILGNSGFSAMDIDVVKPNADITGKVVAADAKNYGPLMRLQEILDRRPAAIVLFSKHAPGHEPDRPLLADNARAGTPVLRIADNAAAAALASAKPVTITIRMSTPAAKPVPARNVIGVLPGSDPELRKQYVIVSAHYDHLGVRDGRIYSGANDNASGVVSIIAIAKAFAALDPRPRRSIIFMALFGEEEGLIGAYYYTHHPLFPLDSTIADINFEQMGRTDEGATHHVRSFSFTGPSYSDLPKTMESAARAEGVDVYVRPDADQFFDRSDNYAFAEAGVVAHTVVVAYEFPEYHEPGDKVQKIDFANMAQVDKGVAAGILAIADSGERPKWLRTVH
ncbi:MAG TPA: M28 family peptidase [Bryobacteraceae bacterium]|nr:M28 family peptidase [Bryobacteraceae bacterium]